MSLHRKENIADNKGKGIILLPFYYVKESFL